MRSVKQTLPANHVRFLSAWDKLEQLTKNAQSAQSKESAKHVFLLMKKLVRIYSYPNSFGPAIEAALRQAQTTITSNDLSGELSKLLTAIQHVIAVVEAPQKSALWSARAKAKALRR